jgi:hypothetical protein
MSLFQNEDILTREIESWKGFAESLRTEQDRMLYMKMLNDCYKYAKAINAKGQPFPTESLIIALLFSQHRLIEWLKGQISKGKRTQPSIFEPSTDTPNTNIGAQL